MRHSIEYLKRTYRYMDPGVLRFLADPWVSGKSMRAITVLNWSGLTTMDKLREFHRERGIEGLRLLKLCGKITADFIHQRLMYLDKEASDA